MTTTHASGSGSGGPTPADCYICSQRSVLSKDTDTTRCRCGNVLHPDPTGIVLAAGRARQRLSSTRRRRTARVVDQTDDGVTGEREVVMKRGYEGATTVGRSGHGLPRDHASHPGKRTLTEAVAPIEAPSVATSKPSSTPGRSDDAPRTAAPRASLDGLFGYREVPVAGGPGEAGQTIGPRGRPELLDPDRPWAAEDIRMATPVRGAQASDALAEDLELHTMQGPVEFGPAPRGPGKAGVIASASAPEPTDAWVEGQQVVIAGDATGAVRDSQSLAELGAMLSNQLPFERFRAMRDGDQFAIEGKLNPWIRFVMGIRKVSHSVKRPPTDADGKWKWEDEEEEEEERVPGWQPDVTRVDIQPGTHEEDLRTEPPAAGGQSRDRKRERLEEQRAEKNVEPGTTPEQKKRRVEGQPGLPAPGGRKRGTPGAQPQDRKKQRRTDGEKEKEENSTDRPEVETEGRSESDQTEEALLRHEADVLISALEDVQKQDLDTYSRNCEQLLELKQSVPKRLGASGLDMKKFGRTVVGPLTSALNKAYTKALDRSRKARGDIDILKRNISSEPIAWNGELTRAVQEKGGQRTSYAENIFTTAAWCRELLQVGVSEADLTKILNAFDKLQRLHSDEVNQWLQKLDQLQSLWHVFKATAVKAFFHKMSTGEDVHGFRGQFAELAEALRILESKELEDGRQITLGSSKQRPVREGMLGALPSQEVDVSFHGADGYKHYHDVKATPAAIVEALTGEMTHGGALHDKQPVVGEPGPVDETTGLPGKRDDAGGGALVPQSKHEQALSYASLREDKDEKKPSRRTKVVWATPSTYGWQLIFTSDAVDVLIRCGIHLQLGVSRYTPDQLGELRDRVTGNPEAYQNEEVPPPPST